MTLLDTITNAVVILICRCALSHKKGKVWDRDIKDTRDSMTTGLRVVAKGRLTSRGEVSSTDLHGFICPRGVSCPPFPPCHCHHDFPLTVTRSSLSVRSFPRYTSSTLSCLQKGGNPDPRRWGARETTHDLLCSEEGLPPPPEIWVSASTSDGDS